MTKQWVQVATIGAKAGTDLKDSAGNLLDNDDVKNTSITLNAAGYLNNIGTQEKLKNALIQANTDGSLNYGGSGSGNPTMNTLTDAGNIRSRLTTALTSSGIVNTTIPENKGGTGLTTAGNAIVNSRVKVNANGTLSYDNTTTGAVTMNTLTDASNIRSRITAGLNTSGDVNRAVPTGKGGTGETNTNKFLNSGIEIAASGTSGLITIDRGDGTTNTTNVTKSQMGLNFSDGATVGAVAGTNLYKENGSTTLGDDDIVTNAGTSANTSAVGNVTASNAQDRLAAITNAGAWDGTTIAIGKGGTGATASTTWLNSNVTTFSVDKGQSIEWTNISGQLSPSATTNDWIITWKNGAGTTLGQTKIRAATSSATSLAAMTNRTSTDGLTAPSGVSVSLGGAANSGVIQTTTVTLNSISCVLTARILDGSGWGFK